MIPPLPNNNHHHHHHQENSTSSLYRAFPPTHKQHDGHGHNEIINGHKHAWENCDVHVHDDNDNDCQTNHDSMLLSSMLLGPSLWALEPTHGPCSQFRSIQAMLAHSACTIHLIRGGPLSPTSSGQHHLPKHWTAILGYQKGCPSHHHTHHTLTHTHTMWAAWPSQAQASQPGIQHMVAHPRSELLWEGNDLPSQCQESTRGGVGQGWGLSLLGGGNKAARHCGPMGLDQAKAADLNFCGRDTTSLPMECVHYGVRVQKGASLSLCWCG